MSRRIAILSYADGLAGQTPTGYSQSQNILDALNREIRREGRSDLTVCRLAWDDPTIDWSTVNLAIPIEAWSYHKNIETFVGWLNAMAQPSCRCLLANGANTILFNLSKLYLADLEVEKIAVVPSLFVGKTDSVRPPFAQSSALISTSHAMPHILKFLKQFSAGVIVKPTISASAHDTIKLSAPDATAETVYETCLQILEGKPHFVDAIIQPYLPEISLDGERSIIFIGGKLLHAVRKVPKSGDFRVQREYGGICVPFTPAAAELDYAKATLATAQRLINAKYGADRPELGVTAYVRCDYVLADDGSGETKPLLMELELIEPELFIPISHLGDGGYDIVAQNFLSLLP